MMSADEQQFQVDLRGVVDLLSRHIYSSPRVYLRELLQNARDAIAARVEADGGGGRILIRPLTEERDEFVLTDDGVGLTAAEVADLLATVGRSSKRDIFDLPRSDYLGQFGIGLLSCFMVADEIVIRSRSARGGAPVEWIGSANGTFRVRELDEDLPVGTSVHLTPRFDQGDLLRTEAVRELATAFAEFLPVQVELELSSGSTVAITRPAPFLSAHDDPEGALEYGKDLLGAAPLDMIELSEPGTGTQGVAYVLPFAPPPGARRPPGHTDVPRTDAALRAGRRRPPRLGVLRARGRGLHRPLPHREPRVARGRRGARLRARAARGGHPPMGAGARPA